MIARCIWTGKLCSTQPWRASHGLCMFDSRLQLVISNNHYREMYALTSAQTIPELPLKEVPNRRLARLSDSTVAAAQFYRLRERALVSLEPSDR